MNVSGFVGKITKNIDDVGKIVGFGYGAQNYGKALGQDLMQHIELVVQAAMTDPHFPNISHVIHDLTKGVSAPALKSTVQIALLGELLSYLGVGGKWANILKKGGWNAALGVGIYSIVNHATIEHSPAPKSSGLTFFASPAVTGDPYAQELYH